MNLSRKLLFLLSPFLYCFSTLANAWLPGENKYKFITSVLFIDSSTRKLQDKKSELALKIYDELSCLYSSVKENDNQQQLKENIQNLRNDLKGFDERFFMSNELEYGISDKQSFGIKMNLSQMRKLNYTYNRLEESKHKFTQQYIKEIGCYHKHSLLNNDYWQVSLVPEVLYSKRQEDDMSVNINVGAYVGFSKLSQFNTKRFTELGFVIGKIKSHSYKKNINFKKFIFLEGFELIKNLFLSNYLEYSLADQGNVLYKNVLYEQLSLAKEFSLNSNSNHNFTIQLGYYWKTGLKYKAFKISGPTISLWMNL